MNSCGPPQMRRLFRLKSKYLDDVNISVSLRSDLSNRDVDAIVFPAPIVLPMGSTVSEFPFVLGIE
jgi:hypothetical protein